MQVNEKYCGLGKGQVEQVEIVKVMDLVPYRHAVKMKHKDGEPYWCHVAMVGWSEDLSKVKIMYDNHCFDLLDADDTIAVQVYETEYITGYRGLPKRAEVLPGFIAKAQEALEKVEKEAVEARRRLDVLLAVKRECEA